MRWVLGAELAMDEESAENIFYEVTNRGLPANSRGFKETCLDFLELNGLRLRVEYFRSFSAQNILIGCGLRISPNKNKSPA
ncbi:MAG: hypothetical protein Q7S36_02650 [Candidatus Liptonbacteria bacterium]|nr:hypothetical protein [Candidatus Liptonbacteria bacterium]